MEKPKNIAFIDAQNLHLGTQTENWKIDFKRFRIYLKDKFNIEESFSGPSKREAEIKDIKKEMSGSTGTFRNLFRREQKYTTTYRIKSKTI